MTQVEVARKVEIRQAMETFIRRNYLLSAEADGFHADSSLVQQGIIDSTGILELVAFVEETFGIAVRDEDLVPDNFDTINRLAGYVERKQAYVA